VPKYKLMAHQKDAVKFLDSVDGIGALLFDPGVGKTGSTLAWLDRLARKRGEVRVLVVAPLAATDTWVLQAPMFMDSVVKSRMMQGSTMSILKKIGEARDWTKVPDTPVMANHPGSLKSQVSGNKVTILSMSSGALSSFCRNDAKANQTMRQRVVQVLRAIRNYQPHVIVVDESHIIKSANSNVSKALYQMGQMVPHRIILTGTVAPHSPLDVYGQWRFLAPWTFSDQYPEAYTDDPLHMTLEQRKGIRPWPWGRFRDRYADMGGYNGKNVVGMNSITIDELHNRVAERSMAMRKEDALDLPAVTDVDVHVALTPKERKAYEEMKRDLAAQLDSGELLTAVNPLSKMMKLRQITSGFAKDSDTGEVHVIGHSMQKMATDLINTTLAGENRIVVFSYFRAECEAMAKALRQKGRTVEVITGSTKARDRLAIRQRFADVSGNPEPTILVAQVTTMSLSVNELVTAQNAVFLSQTQQRDVWVQARGRLDRNGQTKPVTFWNVFVPGTVGEIMLQTHAKRGDLETAMIDHIKGTRK
jgi:hypothetical protein